MDGLLTWFRKQQSILGTILGDVLIRRYGR
jgi:hypothetical protein